MKPTSTKTIFDALGLQPKVVEDEEEGEVSQIMMDISITSSQTTTNCTTSLIDPLHSGLNLYEVDAFISL